MNYNVEPQQFEDWKLSDGDNMNRLTSVCNTSSSVFYIRMIFDREGYFDRSILMNKYNDLFKFLKISFIIQNSQITAISVVLPSSNPSRMIFDRGKKFVICEMCSHCARRNIKFCPEMFISCLISPMEKYDEEYFYDLIRQHGYQLDSSSTNSVVFVLVKDGDCYECENMFARMSDRGCISSYACECLMFDHYRVHQPNLWNSSLEALVAASLKLFQKLLNYMGSNIYELVHLNASSYVIGADVVLVKTSQGGSEDCDTLVADIVHSIDTVKMRYGFLEMFISVMCSWNSEECLYGGQEVAGKVFDRGRLLKLITRCITGRRNVWVLIETSGVHSCMVVVVMDGLLVGRNSS
ncbi:uncharacterized protein LOC113287986 [Papaver somniferum]|uniref:uncharacterized protein LOC113287986 n=1 Tax=Papaver somniferum TaxID=3469 RepID=UPI000E6F70F9|nr:uncharacterized protein LOC113287986 [Papaver somniferum]